MADEIDILGPQLSPTDRIHKTSQTTNPLDALASLTPNPRSCITCRRRKVKCDKKHPCNHCTRQQIDCIYPPPGRAPRKAKRPQENALVERLRRLEAVVQNLSAPSTEEEETSVSPYDAGATDHASSTQEEESVDEKIRRVRKEFKDLVRAKRAQGYDEEDNVEALTEKFGTLIVKEGRSRYINPGFWSVFNAEVKDIKGQIEDWTESEEDDPLSDQPSQMRGNASSSFIFSLSSTNVQMSLLRPPPELFQLYWQTYRQNVDPLLKILHPLIMQPYIDYWTKNMNNLSKDAECNVLAICYAAVTSSWSDDCLAKFGESRSALLARYRFGVEQALARANFLQTDSIHVVKAFIVFLTCLRRQAEPRSVFGLSGLLVRIAQGLGLHRDGSHYPTLAMYKQEMRRTIWWHVIVLDSKMQEDIGSESGFGGHNYDARLPRNLNDTDITFGMTELPESRLGCTDMTYNLVIFEIGQAFSRILRGLNKHVFAQYSVKLTADMLHETLQKRKGIILELEQRIEEVYLKDADLTVPINYMTRVVSRLSLGKMWLMLYQPVQRRDGACTLFEQTRNQLFGKALECVELAVAFRTEARTPRFTNFAWLLQTYVPWQAIAYLLSELCTRFEGEDVDRAWAAIDFCMNMSWTDDVTRKDRPDAHLWRPLRYLRKKAKAARSAALVADPNAFAFKATEGTASNAGTTWIDTMQSQLFMADHLPDVTQPNQDYAGEAADVPLREMQLPPFSPTGLKGAVFPPSSKVDHNGTGVSMNNFTLDALGPESNNLGQGHFPATNAAWAAPSQAVSTQMGVPIGMDDPNMNWSTWDDLVMQWSVQNGDFLTGDDMGPIN